MDIALVDSNKQQLTPIRSEGEARRQQAGDSIISVLTAESSTIQPIQSIQSIQQLVTPEYRYSGSDY